ncbi:MAG TPA: manganese efflux pump MntP family protein [Nocardioides sp.]
MAIAELIVLAFALAMDAVAVSVAQGLRMYRPRWRDALFLAGAFGLFQAVMPLGGWVLSFWFADVVSAVAPWIAFALLAVLGGMMLREAFSDDDEDDDAGAGGGVDAGTAGAGVATYLPLTVAVVLPLAVATSIDAAAVGVTFGVLSLTVTEVLVAVAIIGAITFGLSLAAVFIGSRVGERLGQYAELVGGVILVLIGLRILLDHLGVLG